jgi:hypothetical protein
LRYHCHCILELLDVSDIVNPKLTEIFLEVNDLAVGLRRVSFGMFSIYPSLLGFDFCLLLVDTLVDQPIADIVEVLLQFASPLVRNV